MDSRDVVSIIHAIAVWVGFMLVVLVYAISERDFEPIIMGFVLLPVFLIFRRR